MSFGMEIYSSSGVLIADANLVGFFCRKSVSTTTTTGSGGGNTVPSIVSIPITGLGYTYPVIAISSSAYFAKAGYSATTGDAIFICSGGPGTSLNYYIFDWAPNIPNSTFGIEMFNASGQRTFSSNYFPMQGLTIISSGNYTATGRTLAAGLATMGGFATAGPIDYYLGGFQVIPDPPGNYDSTGYQKDSDLYGARVTNSGQTVEYGSVSFDDIYVGPEPGDIYVPPNWNVAARIIAIDVTNIPLNTTFF